MVVMCKNPNVRMSLMVPKELWPAIVSRLETFELTYSSEKELKNDPRFVRINDISGRGDNIMFFFSSLEAYNTPHEDGTKPKIYILMTARKKVIKHVSEDREEAGAGSEDGTGLGQGDIPGGAGDRSTVVGPDDLRQLEVDENAPGADCD